MNAAINLVNYLYHSKDLYIQYTRSASGNNPQIYERGETVNLRKSMEERLVASTPSPVSNSPDLYIDADYAGDVYTRRSTSGMIIVMNGGPIAWSSRLQNCVHNLQPNQRFMHALIA